MTKIAYNAQGTKVAFVEWGLYKQIFVMNANGSGLVQLTNDAWDSDHPCFSPDGSKILYTSSQDGTPQLYTMNVDGTSKTQLTNFIDGAWHGRYSPNGQKVVFTTGSFQDDVGIMNANGSGATLLAASGTDDENEPTFSADSSKVIFVKTFDSGGDMVGQIMIVSATGGTATRLTTSLLDDREPVASLDGLYILFTRADGVGREVFRMTMAGASQTKITNEGGYTVSPSTGG
ncbi:MAG: hypothetical protein BGO01_07290 [Armatimonadetes bacterium 55-13]|nr:MAG: hypothetical protein BGO01_07290 [Armatimonadetes bacterium 55-13]